LYDEEIFQLYNGEERMIENNFYELMSNAEDIKQMDFVLNLEVLHGCLHHCDGCFVNRNKAPLADDLKNALQIAREMNDKGFRFREVVLGPTDLFSSENIEKTLNDPDFHALMNIHPITRITSASMFETPLERIKEIFAILDNDEVYRRDMIMEFLVPMDVEKLLYRDEAYYNHIHEVVDFMKNGTPKTVDWSFVININYNPLLEKHFDEITAIVRDEFDTIIEFIPSFFRPNKYKLIEKQLHQWGNFLRKVINEDNYKDIMFTSACKTHNGFNAVILNYKRGKVFLSPFVYEQIMLEDDHLQVFDLSADEILRMNNRLIVDQFNYASQTAECSNCSNLSTCIGRNVLTFMESKKITDCIFPKDVFEQYYNKVVVKYTDVA